MKTTRLIISALLLVLSVNCFAQKEFNRKKVQRTIHACEEYAAKGQLEEARDKITELSHCFMGEYPSLKSSRAGDQIRTLAFRYSTLAAIVLALSITEAADSDDYNDYVVLDEWVSDFYEAWKKSDILMRQRRYSGTREKYELYFKNRYKDTDSAEKSFEMWCDTYFYFGMYSYLFYSRRWAFHVTDLYPTSGHPDDDYSEKMISRFYGTLSDNSRKFRQSQIQYDSLLDSGSPDCYHINMVRISAIYPLSVQRDVNITWLINEDRFDALYKENEGLAMYYVDFCSAPDPHEFLVEHGYDYRPTFDQLSEEGKIEYANIISSYRPEEAQSISEFSHYMKHHEENLLRWNFTEEEYLSEREKYNDWDSFYSAMDLRAEQNAARYAEIKRQQKLEAERIAEAKRIEDERQAEIRREAEARRIAELNSERAKIIDAYKPLIEKELSANEYSKADSLANEAIYKSGGGNAYLYAVKAQCYCELNFPDEEDIEIYDVESMFNAYSKEAEELLKLADKALNYDPYCGMANLYKGIACIRLRRPLEAVDALKAALPYYYNHSKGVCYYNLGVAYGNAGMYKEAVENMKEAYKHLSVDRLKRKALSQIEKYGKKL